MNDLALIVVACVAVFTGGYLILKAQIYKDEMAGLGHLFGQFSPWAIRVLGVVILGVAICLAYLATK